MGLHETIPTRQQLYEFARVNEGATMATLYEDKPFQWILDGDRLQFVPSTGTPRNVDIDRVDRLLQQLTITRSLRPVDYQDGSHNASYLLPLVLAWQRGGIKAYQGALARTPLGALTEGQRDALFEKVVKAVGYRLAVKPADRRIDHGFEMTSKATKAWVGTVYWSNNLIGNDVEFAFNLIELGHSNLERSRIRDWFDKTIRDQEGREAWNHSGRKEESWYRAGLSYGAAMEFFDLLRPQLSAMTRDSDRWHIALLADSGSESGDLEIAAASVQMGRDSTTDNLAAAVEPDDPSERSALEATIAMMLDHAQKASDESGKERTTVRKTKYHRFSDDQEFRRHVEKLLQQQQSRCSITGLDLQILGKHSDPELLASLDRIDSNGHYEPGNLQIVCRFVNRWKRDDKDQEFRRLMVLLKTSWSA